MEWDLPEATRRAACAVCRASRRPLTDRGGRAPPAVSMPHGRLGGRPRKPPHVIPYLRRRRRDSMSPVEVASPRRRRRRVSWRHPRRTGALAATAAVGAGGGGLRAGAARGGALLVETGGQHRDATWPSSWIVTGPASGPRRCRRPAPPADDGAGLVDLLSVRSGPA